jgi:hypothetical protein
MSPSSCFIRGEKLIPDADLAVLYGFQTHVLLQTVTSKFMRPATGRWLQTRRGRRFPDDLVFELTTDEFARLSSQTVISRSGTSGAAMFAAINVLIAPARPHQRRLDFIPSSLLLGY